MAALLHHYKPADAAHPECVYVLRTLPASFSPAASSTTHCMGQCMATHDIGVMQRESVAMHAPVTMPGRAWPSTLAQHMTHALTQCQWQQHS